MSEQNDRIDEVVSSLLADDVPEQVRQRLRSQLADFRSRLAEKETPLTAWSADFRRRVWVGVAAVATTVLIVSGAFLVMRPRVSFAEVVAAVQRLPWIHVSATDVNGEKREIWYSTVNDISATRDKGWIEYFDHKLKIHYSYDVDEKVLYRVPESAPRRAGEFVQIAETLRLVLQTERPANNPFDNLKFMGRVGADMELIDQSSSRVEEGGREWLDFHLTARHPKMPNPITFLFRVDPGTKLPELCRVEGKWEGKPVSMEQRFDYPQRGPASVYELGVPQTAKLVDRVPSDDTARIVEALRVGRQKMDDYRAIVVSRMEGDDSWWYGEPMMLYRKGNKTRVDNASWTGQYPRVDKPGDSANMEEWWRKRAKDFVYYPFYITKASAQYSIRTQAAKGSDGINRLQVKSVERTEINGSPGEIFPPYYSRSPEFVCRPPLGIPQQALEPTIEMSPADGPAGSILLRVAYSGRAPGAANPSPKKEPHVPDVQRFWLDPKRDYVVSRWDIIGASESRNEEVLSSIVTDEFKQSPGGVWYASRFRVKATGPVEHDQVFDVYMDFDADLPDSLFDPPSVGQVLSK